MKGMQKFEMFLETTVGIHLLNFWFDAEEFKDSLQIDQVPERFLFF